MSDNLTAVDMTGEERSKAMRDLRCRYGVYVTPEGEVSRSDFRPLHGLVHTQKADMGIIFEVTALVKKGLEILPDAPGKGKAREGNASVANLLLECSGLIEDMDVAVAEPQVCGQL